MNSDDLRLSNISGKEVEKIIDTTNDKVNISNLSQGNLLADNMFGFDSINLQPKKLKTKRDRSK